MRSSSLLLSLVASAATAPLALAAPVPFVLVQDWDVEAIAVVPEAAAVTIDNRHYSPSGAKSASAVLAAPRPLTTTYLMSLARASEVAKAIQALATAPLRAAPAATSELHSIDIPVNTPPSSPSVPSASTRPTSTIGRFSVPCYYSQLPREPNDILVISLLAVFLLVIVGVELYESRKQKEEDLEASPAAAGAIRLEDDSTANSQLRTLSIQANPTEPIDAFRQEKAV